MLFYLPYPIPLLKEKVLMVFPLICLFPLWLFDILRFEIVYKKLAQANLCAFAVRSKGLSIGLGGDAHHGFELAVEVGEVVKA